MKYAVTGSIVFLIAAIVSYAAGSSISFLPTDDREGSAQQQLLYEADRQEELLEEAAVLERRLAFLDEPESGSAADSAVQRLEAEAALSDIEGEGIVITVEDRDAADGHLPPELLRLLLNDSFQAGAEAAALGQERITARTSIREVNGRTLVDGHSAGLLPLDILLAVPMPELSAQRIQESEASLILHAEGYDLTVETKIVELPGYSGSMRLQTAEPAEEEDQ